MVINHLHTTGSIHAISEKKLRNRLDLHYDCQDFRSVRDIDALNFHVWDIDKDLRGTTPWENIGDKQVHHTLSASSRDVWKGAELQQRYLPYLQEEDKPLGLHQQLDGLIGLHLLLFIAPLHTRMRWVADSENTDNYRGMAGLGKLNNSVE